MTKSKLQIKNQKTIVFDLGNELKLVGGKNRQIEQLTDIEIGRDAALEYYFIWQNSSQERNLIIHLNEDGASAKLIGVFWGTDDHQINLQSTIIHHAPNTYGNTLIKGALYDSARARLSGMIKIDKGAHGSDDLLTERVLLLSPKARAEATPMLEIDANEVKATHAATISKINQDHLYYLQTRGLPGDESKKFIVNGFLKEVLDMLPLELASETQLYLS